MDTAHDTASEFRMPSLGAEMEKGTLAEWQIAPGDRVKRGQVVAVVETDKGAMDVEVWHDGVVDTLLVPAGATVPVGTLLATLRSVEAPRDQSPPAAAPPPVAPPAPAVAAPRGPSPPAPAPPPVAPPPPAVAAPPRASPAARRLARERGIELTNLVGSGPSGAVVLADVERAGRPAAAPARAPAAAPAVPSAAPVTNGRSTPAAADGMRRAIAAAMARSKREIPHYYLAHEIDVAPAMAWLERHNHDRRAADRVLPAVLLLRAVALVLRDFPELHGHFVDGSFRPGPIHVGVAVALREGGLVAPAIHDADQLTLTELMGALGDLVRRARTGHLRASEVTDPTVTVTSLGDRSVDSVLGVIYPPQVAIVGLGSVRERPCAVNGLLGVRPMLTATLAGDHRVSDGHRGALFLTRLAEMLGRAEMP